VFDIERTFDYAGRMVSETTTIGERLHLRRRRTERSDAA
jgi:hypothetical protein